MTAALETVVSGSLGSLAANAIGLYLMAAAAE